MKNEEEMTLAGRQFVGAQILKRREQLHMTQCELAERCGMSQSAIARIEAGTNSTGIDLLNRIALALGCEITLQQTNKRKRQ